MARLRPPKCYLRIAEDNCSLTTAAVHHRPHILRNLYRLSASVNGAHPQDGPAQLSHLHRHVLGSFDDRKCRLPLLQGLRPDFSGANRLTRFEHRDWVSRRAGGSSSPCASCSAFLLPATSHPACTCCHAGIHDVSGLSMALTTIIVVLSTSS